MKINQYLSLYLYIISKGKFKILLLFLCFSYSLALFLSKRQKKTDHVKLHVQTTKTNYVSVSILPTAKKERPWPLMIISFINDKNK